MQVRGLAAASASLTKIASAAITVIVPSVSRSGGQPWVDAAPAGGANARWRWLLVRVGLVVERLVEGDQPLLQAEDRGLGAVLQLQLGQDAGDVRLDRLLPD